MITPYPESVGPETISMVLGLFGGDIPEKNEAIHAGWHTVGYILGIVCPDGEPYDLTAAKPMKTKDAIASLEKLTNQPRSTAEETMGAGFNWAALLLALMQALNRQLK